MSLIFMLNVDFIVGHSLIYSAWEVPPFGALNSNAAHAECLTDFFQENSSAGMWTYSEMLGALQ